MPRAPRAASDRPDIWVAKEGFFGENPDGTPLIVNKDERVRDGHPMLKAYGSYFEPVSDHVTFDHVQATQGPNEQRGAPQQ